MKEILKQHKWDGGILEKPLIKDFCEIPNNYESVDSSKWFEAKQRYNSAQTVYELVIMTEYMSIEESNQWKGHSAYNYKNFITQPLTKEMFIGDGRIFEGAKSYKHKDYQLPIITLHGEWFCYRDSVPNITIEQALNKGVKLYWNGK